MSKVKKLEQEIEGLSEAEFSELRDWVLERDWTAWDKQIESDARAGRLDSLIRQAEEGFGAGRSRVLWGQRSQPVR